VAVPADLQLADPALEALRREHAEAFAELVDPIEDAWEAAMRRVLLRAYALALPGASITAAGEQLDLAALGLITDGWAAEVPALTAPVAQLYETGALAAWVTHGDAYQAANVAGLQMFDVVNSEAVDHVAQLTNRLSGVGDSAWAHAQDTIRVGLGDGDTIEELGKRLEADLGVNAARARTVARTESAAAMSAGTLAGVRALGEYGPRIKVWVAAMDARTRDSHWLADGQRKIVSKAFEVGGSALRYPGDPQGPARETVNCRCTLTFEESGNEKLPGEEPAKPKKQQAPAGPSPEDVAAAQAQAEAQAAAQAAAEEAAQKAALEEARQAEAAAREARMLAPSGTADRYPFDPDTLRLNVDEGQGLGGAHAKQVFQDESGELWLFKPQDRWQAELDVATARIQKLGGLEAPDTFVITRDGQVGSIQRMYGSKRTRRQKFTGAFDPAKLQAPDVASLQEHHALDWLIGNHDIHGGQFIRLTESAGGKATGQIIAIDKGQAFKFFGKDKLAHDYNPNGNAVGDSIYNRLHQAFARGDDVDGFAVVRGAGGAKDLRRTLARLEGIPDDEYRAILRPYAELAARSNRLAGGDVEAFLDAAVGRKNRLTLDIRNYHSRLLTQRNKALGRTAARPSVPRGDGSYALKGMEGARTFRSTSEALEWARRSRLAADAPHVPTSARNAVRTYTGGSYRTINGALRQGRSNSTATAMRAAFQPFEEDTILMRGTGADWLPPKYRSNPRAAIGRVVVDDGFISTSVGSEGQGAAFGGQHSLRFRATAGVTRGSFVDDISMHRGEREIVLEAGTHLYVHDARQVANGRWHIDVEVVPKEWAEGSGLVDK
jgi:hypothetical protein